MERSLAATLLHVVLIGDSIRFGYQPTVVQQLQDRCDVWGPAINCQTSRYTLEHLGEMVICRQPDVVHLNCGLHDFYLEDGKVRITAAEYGDNLDRIFTRIRQETSAILIFALTTPIIESRQIASEYGLERREADPALYNAVALQVAARYDLKINNLYNVVNTAGAETMLGDDGIHFAPAGQALLGKAVADSITAVLV